MRTDLRKLYFERALRRNYPKRPPRRLKKMIYPALVEERYTLALGEILKFLKAKVDAKVKPLLPELQKTYGRVRKDEEPETRKYYLAFIYSDSRAEAKVLHCTHKYLGAISRDQLREVERAVDQFFIKNRPELPRVKFDRPALFGEEKNIPVLTPGAGSEPFWPFNDLRETLDDIAGPGEFSFSPHVTTDEKLVDRPFVHYALISKAGIHRTWPKTVKLDDGEDLGDLADALESVRIEFSQAYTKDELKRLAKITGESVSDWNAKQMNGQLGTIAEIDLVGNEPWIAKEMGGFVVENVRLISSIEEEYLGQVEKVVATSVREGIRWEDIADELEDRYDVSRSRAELIARDQVGKFQGQLTEIRQKDLGIEEYVWRTSGDARVRESHREKDGKTFRWDNPPADTGHPGQDYQCRCSAEPVLDQFFED